MAEALSLLRDAGLPERLVIDASHDNSRKDHERQPQVAAEIADQIAEGNRAIVGVMMESFLVAGRQDLDSDRPLVYGQSITDACMDWETTVLALDRLAAAVKLYELGRLSSGAAAQLAGIPRPVFLMRLSDYGVDTSCLTKEELQQETPLAPSPQGHREIEM